jgi:hypothetical protein
MRCVLKASCSPARAVEATYRRLHMMFSSVKVVQHAPNRVRLPAEYFNEFKGTREWAVGTWRHSTGNAL